VGQDVVVDFLLITLITGGHAIIEGVPGLAKTLLINSLAKTLGLSFNRIQFTPDLVPSDITGTEIIEPNALGEKAFRFVKGPIFSNILLADEINRTPPKTQSALLQSMQERRVTILGTTHHLPSPFFVFATQNPIEYEGTYPLPEAQLDRFLLYIPIGYPSALEEMKIIDADPARIDDIQEVVNRAELIEIIEKARTIPVSDTVKQYSVGISRNTRPENTEFDLVRKHVKWGASPRATQMLVQAAQSAAFLDSSNIVDKRHIDKVLINCLKHRLVLNYSSIAEGMNADNILRDIQERVGAGL
jgi:MoxR-like ATPase